MSMKNSNDIIGNRTRDLPTCSTVRRTEGRTQMKTLVGCFLYLWERDIIYLIVNTVHCHYRDRSVRRIIGFRGEVNT